MEFKLNGRIASTNWVSAVYSRIPKVLIFKRNNIVGKIYFNMDKVTRKKNTVLKTTSQNEGETYKSLLKINKIK